MKPTILIASGNSGKVREMLEVLQHLPARFLSLADLELKNTVAETGSTYEENAFLKADYYFHKTGFPTIGEDSGIEVAAIKGELGIKTRRFGAGENATDEEWLNVFLERMKTEKDRRATFFCTAAFVAPEGIRERVTGKTFGMLTTGPMCPIPKGIPISALFIPKGHTTVYASMGTNEKNKVSHRGKAMRQLSNILSKYLSEKSL